MGIQINQVGYRTKACKHATVLKNGTYKVIDKKSGSVVFAGETGESKFDAAAGEECYVFDFSSVKKDGEYYIEGPEAEKSDVFLISDSVYIKLHDDMLKCLYFQRCGCSLDEKYAGVYKHGICHAGEAILLEDYLNKTPDPKRIDVLGGWHDAGDYGRYISPAAVTVGHLMYAYLLFKDSFKDEINIPESGNGVADVLNEARYEIEWMLKLQREDGGVYHKLTAFSHAPFIMPEDDHDQFLLFPVSSMATADFCASMALSSRVYREIDEDFADKLFEASKKAFDWISKNPYVGFHNPEGSNTGEYDDDSDLDERLWAASEMLRTDTNGDTKKYRDMFNDTLKAVEYPYDFGWNDVSGFAMMSVLTDDENNAGNEAKEFFINKLKSKTEEFMKLQNSGGYELAMDKEDYVWGSNMVVAGRGMLFVLAAMCLNDQAYYTEGAENCLHYLFGRNALGRCYVTGYGSHPVCNIHNRTSGSDGIDEPMPGWVSGGPFKTPCDEAAIRIIPKGTAPMKCHADHIDSYSTNEITIYWNSPVVFMTAYINSSDK